MVRPEEGYERWLEDEREARRLDERRKEARRRCDSAISELPRSGPVGRTRLLRELDRLERTVERSMAFYLGHSANDADLLRALFGDPKARELRAALTKRKLSLMNELDHVREMRISLERKRP
jgi:hypothetical protein